MQPGHFLPNHIKFCIKLYVPPPTRHHRSSDANLLISITRTKHCTLRSSALAIAAPALWKSLLSNVLRSDLLHSFKNQLKTHPFKKAYNIWLPLPPKIWTVITSIFFCVCISCEASLSIAKSAICCKSYPLLELCLFCSWRCIKTNVLYISAELSSLLLISHVKTLRLFVIYMKWDAIRI